VERHHPRREPEARLKLFSLVWGYRLSQAIHVAARLGIPDLLADGALSAEALAAATDTHAPSLHRVLRALAGAGILDEVEGRRFRLTAMGQPLRSNVGGSIRAAVLMLLSEWNWEPWAHLEHTVRTGETAFSRVHGMPVFDYLSANPQAAASFDAAMGNLSAMQADCVAGACDLSAARAIMDVGGGRGTLLASLLRRYPGAAGLLFDVPHVAREARAALEREGMGGRCRIVGGNFFERLPEGADACVLRDILHDWDDEHALLILKNCRAALPCQGRLLLVERLVAADAREALPTLLADLEMLVNIGGRERSEEELRCLLLRAGFRWERCTDLGTGSQHRLVEALASE
jgi:hypothetical protein